MSPPTLLIFGGSGFVGGNLGVSAVQHGWHVVVADTSFHPGITVAEWREVDITKQDAVDRVLEDVHPDVAVNLAALADIDRVEQEKALARQINVQGAAHVAGGCARWGIHHIFFSSDAIFDGSGGPYREDDAPNPVNYYGITKAEAENAVSRGCPQSVIVRVSLVLGFPVTAGNSFLAGLEEKLIDGKEILCPVDEIRTPVDVHTLCDCVLELAASPFEGVLHIGCRDSVDRYELTRRAASEMGFSVHLVQPKMPASESPGRAPRHRNGILDISKAISILNTQLLDLDNTIKKAVSVRN